MGINSVNRNYRTKKKESNTVSSISRVCGIHKFTSRSRISHAVKTGHREKNWRMHSVARSASFPVTLVFVSKYDAIVVIRSLVVIEEKRERIMI